MHTEEYVELFIELLKKNDTIILSFESDAQQHRGMFGIGLEHYFMSPLSDIHMLGLTERARTARKWAYIMMCHDHMERLLREHLPRRVLDLEYLIDGDGERREDVEAYFPVSDNERLTKRILSTRKPPRFLVYRLRDLH